MGPPRGCDMSPTKRPFQPTFLAFSAEPLEEGDQFWMAPIAVARQPHDLPGRAVDRQRHGAGETTGGIEADRAGGERNRLGLAREQFLRRRRRRIGMRQRRQRRLSSSVPGILRQRRSGMPRAAKRTKQGERNAHLNSPCRRAARGTFSPKCDGARPATIRCRESLVLSSCEQVAGVAVERQQPLFGRRMRLDRCRHAGCGRRQSPRSARRRATSKQRWQSSGSRSAHIRQTRDVRRGVGKRGRGRHEIRGCCAIAS